MPKRKKANVAAAKKELQRQGFISKASAETCAICTGMDGD